MPTSPPQITDPAKVKNHRSNGFTLVELVAVLVIIMILATTVKPLYRNFTLASRLQRADVFLQSLASMERRHYQRHGEYYVSSGNDEQDLEDSLGISLKGAGAFCFLVRTSGFISDSGAEAEFEVWAMLRDDNYTSASSGNDVVGDVLGFEGTTCTTADDKDENGGWVADDSGDKGGEGRLVVLRYPPMGGEMDTHERNGRSGITLRWDDGISYSDALL